MTTRVFLSVPEDADGNELDPVLIVEGTGEQVAEESVHNVDIDDSAEVIKVVNVLLRKHNLALELLSGGSFDAYWLRVKPLT